jgi:hypothetical protein
MLFRHDVLEGIRDGRITLAFRVWRRPTVKAGGSLLTPVGELRIGSVATVDRTQISEAEALHAGYASLKHLLDDLRGPGDALLYRIELGPVRPDPRLALRSSATLSDEERHAVIARLQRLDAGAAGGRWTEQMLDLIDRHPGMRAGDLCRLVDQEKAPFKLRVRKLKALGLTESLETGYRLSPRGAAVLRAIRR